MQNLTDKYVLLGDIQIISLLSNIHITHATLHENASIFRTKHRFQQFRHITLISHYTTLFWAGLPLLSLLIFS